MSTETASASSSPVTRPGLAAHFLILLVEAYRVILSPLLGGFCRFSPSCSVYAQEALRRHGASRGTRLSLLRLLRCHPFHAGGHDPVP
jgi:uncharacterized protein